MQALKKFKVFFICPHYSNTQSTFLYNFVLIMVEVNQRLHMLTYAIPNWSARRVLQLPGIIETCFSNFLAIKSKKISEMLELFSKSAHNQNTQQTRMKSIISVPNAIYIRAYMFVLERLGRRTKRAKSDLSTFR